MMPDPDEADGNLIQADESVQSALDGLETQFGDLQRQIDALQRLASLGTVCSMIAHEFNNVMTPIISYCQYALQRNEPELMRTALDRTLKNAQRLTSMSMKILGLATGDPSDAGHVRVRSAVEDAVACLGRDFDKDSITLTLDIPDELSVRGHVASLQQVLFNLILNARQAMLGLPGRLTISARRIENQHVSIDVADTGCGIKSEHLEKLFEPFFSTKRHESRTERGGIGLGLHVCKRLMADMNGDISVRSRPGEGTTFTLTLPGA